MFGDKIDRFAKMEVMNVPVGGGVYLAAAQAVSKTVLEFLEFLKMPPVVTGVAGAWAVNNLDVVRRFLGTVGAYDLSKVMVMQSVNSQFDISGAIERMLGQAEQYIPFGGGEETAGLPAPTRTTEPVGQIPREEEGPNLDIYDEYMDQAEIT